MKMGEGLRMMIVKLLLVRRGSGRQGRTRSAHQPQLPPAAAAAAHHPVQLTAAAVAATAAVRDKRALIGVLRCGSRRAQPQGAARQRRL
jgi:hypothetical protein